MDQSPIMAQSAGVAKSAGQSGTSRPKRSKTTTPKDGGNMPPEIILATIQELCNQLPAPEYNVVVSGMAMPGASEMAFIAIYGATVRDGMLVSAGSAGKGGAE